jgi:hypothetical protein
MHTPAPHLPRAHTSHQPPPGWVPGTLRPQASRHLTARQGGDIATCGARRYLRATVASFARSQPADLGAALLAIKQQMEMELSDAGSSGAAGAGAAAAAAQNGMAAAAGAAGGSVAEDALKHLLLTVDAEELYRAALGLYDLPLAYLVVVHAQVGGPLLRWQCVCDGGRGGKGRIWNPGWLRRSCRQCCASVSNPAPACPTDAPRHASAHPPACASARTPQRDPAEAMLELQQLGAVPQEQLRHARIDLHLQRCAAHLLHGPPGGCRALQAPARSRTGCPACQGQGGLAARHPPAPAAAPNHAQVRPGAAAPHGRRPRAAL